jgi:tetratricopeptide (TPR) repeat protein
MRAKTLSVAVTAVLCAGLAQAAELGQVQPIDVQRLSEQAAVHAARGRWDAAVASYRQAIAASPRDATLYNRLGTCYLRAGDSKNARSQFKAALDLRKDYAEAWNNLGAAEHARGKYKAAISAYRSAIKIKPDDAVFYRNLGGAWLARGDAEKALEAWGEAYRLDPASATATTDGVAVGSLNAARHYHLLAKLVASRGDVEQALVLLGKARDAGFRDFRTVGSDPDFAAVIQDPRYAEIVR